MGRGSRSWCRPLLGNLRVTVTDVAFTAVGAALITVYGG
jgi:hypothetical protein